MRMLDHPDGQPGQLLDPMASRSSGRDPLGLGYRHRSDRQAYDPRSKRIIPPKSYAGRRKVPIPGLLRG